MAAVYNDFTYNTVSYNIGFDYTANGTELDGVTQTLTVNVESSPVFTRTYKGIIPNIQDAIRDLIIAYIAYSAIETSASTLKDNFEDMDGDLDTYYEEHSIDIESPSEYP